MDAYETYDATGLAQLVKAGEVTPAEIVEAAIERAERLNPALNAIIHPNYERARRLAADVDPGTPFAGVPFLMKDYTGEEAGEPYHMGVSTLRELDYRPPADSALTTRFRALGLVSLGRTNTPEMALMGTTEPQLYGPTHNPWAPGRSTGGSSGGSAAAVAAGIVPAAHATDISGSIRIPAGMCGLVGLKPTRGRVLMSGADAPIGMTAESVLTRTVRDTAALVDAIADTSPWWPAPALERPLAEEVGRPSARLRVGVWTEAFNGGEVDACAAAAAEEAGRLLAELGHDVETAAPSEYSSAELWDLARTALAASAAAEAARWTDRIGRPLGAADVEPRTWSMIEAGQALTAADLYLVIERMQAVARRALAWWDDFDLLVTPTNPVPPALHGDYLRRYTSGLGSAFTRPVNVTGQPAISLPLGWPDDGLPRGVQLVGGYGREDVLIRVAGALEEARPWAHRYPASTS